MAYTEKTVEKIYRRLAKNYRLRIKKPTSSIKRNSTYTGVTIQPYGSGTDWLCQVAHEIGHFFAADPEFRYLPEYALGRSFESFRFQKDPRILVGFGRDPIEEEIRASFLGIWLTRQALGHSVALDLTWLHNWHGWQQFTEQIHDPVSRKALFEMRDAWEKARSQVLGEHWGAARARTRGEAGSLFISIASNSRHT